MINPENDLEKDKDMVQQLLGKTMETKLVVNLVINCQFDTFWDLGKLFSKTV